MWALPQMGYTDEPGEVTLRAKFELPPLRRGCPRTVRFNENFEDILLAGEYHDFASPRHALVTLSIQDHHLVVPTSTFVDPCISQDDPPTILWSQWSSSVFLCHEMPRVRVIWGYRIIFPDRVWDFSPHAVRRTRLPCSVDHNSTCDAWHKVMPTTLRCRTMNRVFPEFTEFDRLWIAETSSGPKASQLWPRFNRCHVSDTRIYFIVFATRQCPWRRHLFGYHFPLRYRTCLPRGYWGRSCGILSIWYGSSGIPPQSGSLCEYVFTLSFTFTSAGQSRYP